MPEEQLPQLRDIQGAATKRLIADVPAPKPCENKFGGVWTALEEDCFSQFATPQLRNTLLAEEVEDAANLQLVRKLRLDPDLAPPIFPSTLGSLYCKFIYDMMGKPMILVKGMSHRDPVYFFSFVDDASGDVRNYREKAVYLSRMYTGTTTSGEEYQTVYSFSLQDGSPRLSSILHEEAMEEIIRVRKGIDFATRGYEVVYDGASVRSAVYKTFQLASWNGDALSIAGRYENGKLIGFTFHGGKGETLAFLKAHREEAPLEYMETYVAYNREESAIDQKNEFDEFFSSHEVEVSERSEKAVTLVIKRGGIEGAAEISLTFPFTIDDTVLLQSPRTSSALLDTIDAAYQRSFFETNEVFTARLIRHDPEIDVMLNAALNSILKVYSDRLATLYLTGGIAHGQKRPFGDIDLYAVIEDGTFDKNAELPGFAKIDMGGTIGSYKSQRHYGVQSGVELHTVSKSMWDSDSKGRLRRVSDYVKKDAVKIWERVSKESESFE